MKFLNIILLLLLSTGAFAQNNPRIDALDRPNIRSSEGAGTTTLTVSDRMWQMFNLSAARTAVLPTTGIVVGQRIRIENRGTGKLTIQSSGGNDVCVVDSLYASCEMMALQAAPTSAAHWYVSFVYSDKEYNHGTTYNGGIAPTITPGSGTIGGSFFVPFQTKDGTWFLDFNVSIAGTSSIPSLAWTVNGILTPASNPDWQSITGGSLSSGTSARTYSRIGSSTNNFETNLTGNASSWIFSGRIRLASKPTWAY